MKNAPSEKLFQPTSGMSDGNCSERKQKGTKLKTLLHSDSDDDLDQLLKRVLGTSLVSGDAQFDVHRPEEDTGEYKCPKCRDRLGWTVQENGHRYWVHCQCRERKILEAKFRKARIPYEYWDIKLPISDTVETFAHRDVIKEEIYQIDINKFLTHYINTLPNQISTRKNLLLFGNNGSGEINGEHGYLHGSPQAGVFSHVYDHEALFESAF